MRDGLGEKCAVLCYIVVRFLFKLAFGTSSIMYFIVFYIVYMELVSLFENCDKLGVKIPEKLKEKINNGGDNNE
jgi:phage-related holin